MPAMLPTLPCIVVARCRSSLSARLNGALDRGLAASVAELLRRHCPLRHILLDATGLERVDPVGALLLASALERHEQQGTGVVLSGMRPGLRRMLREHPLARYCEGEEMLFRDPDLEGWEVQASGR